MQPTKMINPQSGNVLFYILIAVVLFGALGFAVSGMMRGGSGGGIGKEKASLYAAEILTYAKQIDDTVKNMQILNDCADEEISFENSTVSGYEHSPVARDECKAFHPDGGGMTYRAEAEWFDDSYAGFYQSGVDNGVSGGMSACLTVECSPSSSPEYTMFYHVLKAR